MCVQRVACSRLVYCLVCVTNWPGCAASMYANVFASRQSAYHVIYSHTFLFFFSVKRDPYISAFEEQLSTIARACFSFQNKNRFLFSVLVSLRPSIKRLDRYYNYISKKSKRKCVSVRKWLIYLNGDCRTYLCWLAKPISALIESD